MTSYSLYATNLMTMTPEGDLPTDPEVAEDYTERIISCLSAGAARTMLDSSHDVSKDGENENADTNAVEWHSADEGWELNALDEEIRKVVDWAARTMLTARFHEVLGLANWLAWEDNQLLTLGERSLWFHDFGMALYRVGGLLGYTLVGAGIGLADYPNRNGDELDAWARDNGLNSSVETWVDGDETPCLLHGSVDHRLKDTMANPE